MFLKQKSGGHHLVEVLGLNDLFNPDHARVVGRLHYGEEVQEPEGIPKVDLSFLSGEDLPRCWVDPLYRREPRQH